jgi:hypothetical protein
MAFAGALAPSGALGARVIHAKAPPLSWKIRNLPSKVRGLQAEALHIAGGAIGLPVPIGRLYIQHKDANGQWTDYGCVSARQVTNSWCSGVASQLVTETSVFGDWKYHESGTATAAEAATDTTLSATTAGTRTAGDQATATTLSYRSICTVAYTGTAAITEHGLFNATAAGTLMDRSMFAAINVVNTDSVAFTYTITLTAGG